MARNERPFIRRGAARRGGKPRPPTDPDRAAPERADSTTSDGQVGDAHPGDAPAGEAHPTDGAPERPRAQGEKRERILAAAIRVFAEKGFYSTRVSEIAQAAGVADGTIYLYFKNKDDVLVSIFEERIGALVAMLREELPPLATTEAKVRRIIDVQMGLLAESRDLAEVITVNLRQSSLLLKQYAAPLFNEYLELIASVLAEGQASGALRGDVRPMLAARALWGAIDGIALTWALGNHEPGGLQRAASQLTSMFWSGVKAAEATATPLDTSP